MKNLDLLRILLKWKVTLAVVMVIAIVLSAIFSSPFFIKPKYRSTAVIYPSNLIPYSQESSTEQMLQLFQSDSIFSHIAGKFHLVQHYDLDSSHPSLRHELQMLYNESVSIKKTEYEAVKIDVMDKDAVMASEMIKEMIAVFNASTLKLQRAKATEIVDIVQKQLRRKQASIDSINTALKELAVKFGLIDYGAQSKELAKEYYKSLGGGNEKKISELTNQLRNLEERGGQFRSLQFHLQNAISEYDYILGEYNKAVRDRDKELTYTNVVIKPVPADKKSYPIRWLIVTVAAFAAILFALVIIIVIEGRKNNPELNP